MACLPCALSFGYEEIYPERQILVVKILLLRKSHSLTRVMQDLDNNIFVKGMDSDTQFHLTEVAGTDQEEVLFKLQKSWTPAKAREVTSDPEWLCGLAEHLDELADSRISRVSKWLDVNTQQFNSKDASFDSLKRLFDNMTVDLKANIQMCKIKCSTCHLLCLRMRHHDEEHDCRTSHECTHPCAYLDEHLEEASCGMK